MVEALLIDAMGTLLALEPPAQPLCAELRRRFGIAISPAQAQAALGAEIAFYRASMGRGRDRESLAALRRDCAEVLRAELPPLRDLDGDELTAALLAALRFRAHPEAAAALAEVRAAGVKRIVVVSNWDASLPEVVERVGLRGCVDAVVSSAAAGAAKPAPEIFSIALGIAGVPAAAAIHVGDSLAEDVAGARAAGVAPVLLDRGGDHPTGAGCPVIATLDGLVAVLASSHSRGRSSEGT